MSVKAIRLSTGVETAGSILQKNHYEWFVRVKRGVYQLSEKAPQEMKSFKSAYDKAKINDTGAL